MFQPEKDFEEYGMFVFKYLMSLCGNADLAEELTQETFYRAIRLYIRLQQISLHTFPDFFKIKRTSAPLIHDAS